MIYYSVKLSVLNWLKWEHFFLGKLAIKTSHFAFFLSPSKLTWEYLKVGTTLPSKFPRRRA